MEYDQFFSAAQREVFENIFLCLEMLSYGAGVVA